jgi:hypothetical protein
MVSILLVVELQGAKKNKKTRHRRCRHLLVLVAEEATKFKELSSLHQHRDGAISLSHNRSNSKKQVSSFPFHSIPKQE